MKHSGKTYYSVFPDLFRDPAFIFTRQTMGSGLKERRKDKMKRTGKTYYSVFPDLFRDPAFIFTCQTMGSGLKERRKDKMKHAGKTIEEGRHLCS